MRKAEIICAVIIMCIGILVVYDSVRLNIGWGMNGPDPGFFPFILGMIVVIGCIYTIAQAIARKGIAKSDKPFIPKGALKPILNVIIPASLMVLLTEYIGLYISAGLYMAVYMRWIGRNRWTTVLILSISIPLITYFVFDKVFLIPMPKGSLEGIIGF